VRKVNVSVELEEQRFRAFEQRAAERGVPVETLVSEAIQLLLADAEESERESLEPPIMT
jgi:predicted DNA binding CopG/RHH family protein